MAASLCFAPELVYAAIFLATVSQVAILILFFYLVISRDQHSSSDNISTLSGQSMISRCDKLRDHSVTRRSPSFGMVKQLTSLTVILVIVGLIGLASADEDTLDHLYISSLRISDCPQERVHFELMSGREQGNVTSYKVTRDLQPEECVTMCKKDARCQLLTIDYMKGSCDYSSDQLTKGSSLESPAKNVYHKICLTSPTSVTLCDQRDWSFELVPDSDLTGLPMAKAWIKANSRVECQCACADYDQFVCRSATWRPKSQECRLSPFNRYSVASDTVKMTIDEEAEYLENNCVHEAKGFCNFKTFPGRRMLLAERILLVATADQCERECLTNGNFVCRSFTYEPGSGTCSLSHHVATRSAMLSLARNSAAVYHEVADCYEVSVDCEPEMMRVKVLTNVLFHGKIYTRDGPTSCFMDIINDVSFDLPVQLTGQECGTRRVDEGRFSNVLVIQRNDQLIRATDKAIGIECSYGVGNQTTGFSTLEVTDVRVTEKRGRAHLPSLSLHVVDGRGQELDQVAIGEILRVQVRMSDENTYGIFVRNLVARDGQGASNLTLIDQTGCPGEARMMREVRTIDNRKSLESYFEAFTFTGSERLQLEAEVETCLDRCRPVKCKVPSARSDDDFETVYSYGRKRRSPDQVTKGDIVDERTLHRTIRIVAKDDRGTVSPVDESTKKRPTTGSKKNRTSSTEKKKAQLPVKSTTPTASGLAFEMDAEGHFCFEPNVLSAISGATLVVQVLSLMLALILGTHLSRRANLKQTKHNHQNLGPHCYY
ncbi:hypothetical protein HDE_09141 [Halotydeus destructor]|nr:hypothetical protein HDE_09141 [Halotydeus destructor]